MSAPGAASPSLLSPAELARRRTPDSPLLLLDVRSADERRRGHLPGDVGVPLSELPERLAELPKGRPIVVYDRRGEFAPRAAGLLGPAGFGPVAALAGGLEAYARDVDPSVGWLTGGAPDVFLAALPRPETGCLAYLLGDPVERRAILVDPGLDVAPYLARLREGDWSLSAIVETHSHADHLAGHADLHAKTDAPVYVSRRSPAAYPHRSLESGEEIRAGALALGILESPGHTLDHLTLTLGDRLFTGDSLFLGACGRTDLPGGDPNRLFDTFRERYDPLPDATEVHPAHFGPRQGLPEGFASTLGIERATNEALRFRDRAAFVRYMTEGWPPKPADFDRILTANLADAPASR